MSGKKLVARSFGLCGERVPDLHPDGGLSIVEDRFVFPRFSPLSSPRLPRATTCEGFSASVFGISMAKRQSCLSEERGHPSEERHGSSIGGPLGISGFTPPERLGLKPQAETLFRRSPPVSFRARQSCRAPGVKTDPPLV
jgi:hypothetical protein